MSWPWRLDDQRPHGWFTAAGLTKFGPIPEREKQRDHLGTWPPRTLEATPTMEEARQHFASLTERFRK